MKVEYPPRISRQYFKQILLNARSNAVLSSNELYDACVAKGIDPTVALAFFWHESTYGTAGVGKTHLNWGNLRSGKRQLGTTGGFAVYRTWLDGLQDWLDLITTRYIARGLDTVEKIVPVYAPSSDGNAPLAYIKKIVTVVNAWSGH